MRLLPVRSYVLLSPPIFAITVLLSTVLAPSPAVAQWCSNHTRCSADMVCLPSWIPFVKQCQRQPCNADSECPQARPSCSLGFCRAPEGAGTGSSGGGIPQSGEGQACGRVSFGGVIKSVGCRHPLQCVSGRCRRPPT